MSRTSPGTVSYTHLTFVDVIIDEAHDPARDDILFKGNVDLQKYENLIKKVGPEKIPYITVGVTVNMAGGQPVSMANLRDVYKLCLLYTSLSCS